jgi:hypothetical protein
MPRNYPPFPAHSDEGFASERTVWEALQALPDDAVVIAQYRVLDDRRVTREADLLVLLPDVGIAVVEVKGGRVWTSQNQWFSTDRRGIDHELARSPLEQAALAGYAIAAFIWEQTGNRPQWTPVAVLPGTRLPAGFLTADSSAKQWIDRGGMPDLAARLTAAAYQGNPPTRAEVESVVEALEHRLPRPRAWERAQSAEARADMITRDQYAILRALRANNRILVTGGPGTGKTWLALEHAREETVKGARVAVLCYNRGLAQHMQRLAGQWPPGQRPAYIGTLHQLALDWTAQRVPDDADAIFWDSLPSDLEKAAAAIAEEYRFNVVVVDEAQDFDASWWLAVRALLDDPDESPMVVFGDDDQNIYDGDLFTLPAVEVTLAENVRNTVEIAEVLQAVSDEPVDCRGAHGPSPTFVKCRTDDAVDVADRAAATLLADGQYRPGDIAVLTTHRRHPVHTQRLEEVGPVAFTDTLHDPALVAYATVKGFKGLERAVVVLAINGFHEQADARAILRVGISRATHQLVVVGEQEYGEVLGLC